MNIKEIPTNELKAIAYDMIAQTEQCQANLKALNQEIALRNEPKVDEPEQELVGEEAEEAPVE